MACARRHLDSLRLAALTGTWHRVDTCGRTQYLRVWSRRALAVASRPESIRIVGKFTQNNLHPRAGQLWISQALYRQIEHRRRAVQFWLLDHSGPGFLPLAGGQGCGSGLAHQQRPAMVGRPQFDGATAGLAPGIRRGTRLSSSGAVRWRHCPGANFPN